MLKIARLMIIVVALPVLAPAQSDVQGELNRAKAALHGRRFADAAPTFEKLAQAGHPEAQFYLGRMAASGLGMPKDLAKVTHWYRGAADQGHTEAQARLGSYYFKEDRAKAHAFYRQAAALGNVQAREALATFNNFAWPDQRSFAIYDERVSRYAFAIQGCQAEANTKGHAVTCLVPVVDWNPKTWEDC